jgi:hypothetical protein
MISAEDIAMSFETITTDDLIRIANAGLGFTLRANSKPLDDLIRIAEAAKSHGAKITFTELADLSAYDIKRIHIASNGSVQLEQYWFQSEYRITSSSSSLSPSLNINKAGSK